MGIVEMTQANATVADFDRFLAIKRQFATEIVREHTQVIEAENVVCVTMRIHRGVGQADPFASATPFEQLLHGGG